MSSEDRYSGQNPDQSFSQWVIEKDDVLMHLTQIESEKSFVVKGWFSGTAQTSIYNEDSRRKSMGEPPMTWTEIKDKGYGDPVI